MSDYDTRRHDERLTAVMLMKISIRRHPELDFNSHLQLCCLVDIILGTGTGSAFLVREVQPTLTFVRVTFGTADPVLTCVRMTKRQGDVWLLPRHKMAIRP